MCINVPTDVHGFYENVFSYIHLYEIDPPPPFWCHTLHFSFQICEAMQSVENIILHLI